MRKLLSLLCFVVFLGISMPAQAQLRENVRHQDARAQVYGQNGPAFSLNQLFSPQHFQMNHSYEMSFGSFGGSSSSLGMYTNTMRFQFNSKLAARVDMAYAFSPFGQGGAFGAGSESGRMFLRNAEIAYRPTEKMQFHLRVRQSPFGRYMSPYGAMSPYGYNQMYSPFGYDRGEDLFWNDDLR